MKVPEELQMTWQRPVSCLGRVIPAALAPLAPVLAGYEEQTLKDISGVVLLITATAMIGAFFSAWSAWLSTGSAAARAEIKANGHVETTGPETVTK